MANTDGLLEARGGIQVISRAAAVLRALKGAPAGMSLGQIAERVGLPRSTVQRIVGALQAERLVIGSAAGGGIRLGPELQALAESARYTLVEMIRPLLLEISRTTQETIDMSVLRGHNMIFVDQIPGTQRLRAVSSVGDVFPLTTPANGKACLALLDNDTVTRLARAEWARTGVAGDIDAFLRLIDEVRESGIAYDLDEHTEGISAVGIGFSDRNGDLYAVSIPTPTSRFRKTGDKMAKEIAALRGRIEAVLAA